MSDFNKYEQKIGRVLINAKRRLTTTEISKITKFSWKTSKDNLESLKKKAPVIKEELGNRTYWYIRKE